jgi:CheY-like chemotaxis protein
MSRAILYVEDNPLVAAAIRDVLEFEGWRVTWFADGIAALREIQSATPYDLLLLDHELPGIDGVQLIRHARTLTHREHTPMILMSAAELGGAAKRAGANLFLQKPEGVPLLVSTIVQLFNQAA